MERKNASKSAKGSGRRTATGADIRQWLVESDSEDSRSMASTSTGAGSKRKREETRTGQTPPAKKEKESANRRRIPIAGMLELGVPEKAIQKSMDADGRGKRKKALDRLNLRQKIGDPQQDILDAYVDDGAEGAFKKVGDLIREDRVKVAEALEETNFRIDRLERESRAKWADLERQTRKTCLTFKAKELVPPKGIFWDKARYLKEVQDLTKRKFGLEIPDHEVAMCHALRPIQNGKVILQFLNRKEGSAFAKLADKRALECGWKGVDQKLDLVVEMSTSKMDSDVFGVALWLKVNHSFVAEKCQKEGWSTDDFIEQRINRVIKGDGVNGQVKLVMAGDGKNHPRWLRGLRDIRPLMSTEAAAAYAMDVDPRSYWPAKLDRKNKGKGKMSGSNAVPVTERPQWSEEPVLRVEEPSAMQRQDQATE